MTDEEMRATVIDLLHWLEGKNLETREAIGICGFTMTSLTILADNPTELAEEICGIYRRSVAEHLERHPPKRRKRRTH